MTDNHDSDGDSGGALHLPPMNSDLAGFGKIGEALIGKVASAIGWAAKPSQVVRMAKAQVKADEIKALGTVDRKYAIRDREQEHKDRLATRAEDRAASKAIKQQENFEAVLFEAASQFTDDSKIADLNEDFVTRLVGEAENVSDGQMRSLWAKLLSSEATSPGTFSRRLIDVIGGMGRSEADSFLSLAKFADRDSGIVYIYEPSDEYYASYEITYEVLGDLSALGVLSVNPGGWRVPISRNDHLDVEIRISILGTTFLIPMPTPGNFPLSTGMVQLTTYGKQLLMLIDPYPEPASGLGERILAAIRNYNGNAKILESTVIAVPPV